ncbi:2-amino-4-hydroxy-6-hydroxymethyldihydropteridine diphosphokinase [Candidatus Pantoea edessiphila]|uniref:2-amino-4-hydroxy-6-hydroxymethyldihydropteridine pyrophosphokinase n=1 Tax=Candidatus Pantoea edessiphila TaxID=2044610 RepID=A0A2P5SWB6_9GAMM|nr:2-amino-4-hydroxy-6-hydroxymethyldihydropteridine diphosphokinase [Candidatus Pantoea edessiphila]PPI86612.1 2-amino-4-hydroxy-6-hydroxymethyldihydropteridine diphosphokinase [Candidatus Pantoea edessiphila]
MTITYLALGSNLNNPLNQIKTALTCLDAIPNTKRIKTSKIYLSPPYGLQNQPDYLNIVVSLDTKLSVDNLFKFTQKIELQQGRVREIEHWGPRTLDIDIILFGNLIIKTNSLIIPHYDLTNRVFMLLPLIQIAPNIILPNGKSVKTILTKLDTSNIKIWQP